MCMPDAPKPPPPVAAPVPLPLETSKPASVDSLDKLKRSGRSRLTVPGASSASTTGMSGLNIPK